MQTLRWGRRGSVFAILTIAMVSMVTTEARAQVCLGDCNGDRTVSVNELVLGVDISLAVSTLADCPAFDDGAGDMSISTLVRAVSNLLNGCQPVPTPTPSPTPTPTPAPGNTEQLAIWAFDTLSGVVDGTTLDPTDENVVGVPTLQIFNQFIDSDGKNGIAYIDHAGTIHQPGRAIAWDDFRGAGPDGVLTITINTTGFEELSLRFDGKENDNPLDFGDRLLRISYSTDGISFIEHQTVALPNNATFVAHTIDLSAVTVIEDAANVVLRFDQGGSDDTDELNDSVSFDNIEISGKPLPEA